jgi:hypothetical protein
MNTRRQGHRGCVAALFPRDSKRALRPQVKKRPVWGVTDDPVPHDYFRFAGAFLRTIFFAGAFFAATFFTTGFLGAVFLETLFFADGFLAAAFLGGTFLGAAFFAAGFLGAAFFLMGVVLGGGFTFPSDRPAAAFLTLNAAPGFNPSVSTRALGMTRLPRGLIWITSLTGFFLCSLFKSLTFPVSIKAFMFTAAYTYRATQDKLIAAFGRTNLLDLLQQGGLTQGFDQESIAFVTGLDHIIYLAVGGDHDFFGRRQAVFPFQFTESGQ